MSDSEVTVKVLFFAKAKELTGVKEASLTVNSAVPISHLKDTIIAHFSLEDIANTLVLAINEEWVDNSSVVPLKENDIIAVIPPLSGDVNKISTAVKSPSCGAVSMFIGTTRDNFEGKDVLQLEYDAYESMANKALTALANELRNKFDIKNVAIHHRLGVVPVLEASVVIAVASEHRQASLNAVSYAIDSLKTNVPIFKKEVYGEDGSSEWKANPELKETNNVSDVQYLENVSQVSPCQSTVPSELVQIHANAKEINRRITSFMKRKREELDRNNLQDFCFHGAQVVESEYSCARVDASLIRNKNTYSHLKVSRVENLMGPQIADFKNLKESTSIPSQTPCSTGIEERLGNSEKYLGLSGGTIDVYSRLKAVEDRILYLESISPEYHNIYNKVESNEVSATKKVTTEELKRKAEKLEKKLQSKVPSYSIN